MNWSPNFAEWGRIAKIVGGAAAAAGSALGAVTPFFAPLAVAIPALAGFGPVLLAVGIGVHGIGTAAKATVDALTNAGVIGQGPK